MIRVASPRRARRARIEIVPLIDIIFFLLASFVMLSLSMVHGRGIDVDLPAAKSGRIEAAESAVVISISKENIFFWDARALAPSDLESRAAEMRGAGRNFIIRADKRASAESIVSALDALSRAGVDAASVQTVLADG